MSEGNTIVRYWKISPGRNGKNWKEFKDNEWISIGFYRTEGKDWRKTKSGDLTKNPDKELIKKALKEEYEEALFSWDRVPGIDSNKLLDFLKDYHEIDWVENAKIIKTEKERTIRIDTEEDPIEITLNENNIEAILKIGDQQMDTLPVKEENGQLNIYNNEDAAPSERSIASWAGIVRLFLEIKPGDKVIVYDKKFHINAMGEVTGEYELEKEFRYPHTKKVKWLQIFDEPLDIKPIKNELDTNISLNRTVIEMNKKDWDIISDYVKSDYAKGIGTPRDIVHVTKDLIEKAFDELGKKRAPKIELLNKLRNIVEREGETLVDDETALKEIQKLNNEKI